MHYLIRKKLFYSMKTKSHKQASLFLFLLFMVFFSVNAIQKWPNLWAQTFITLACILPAFFILVKKPLPIQDKDWSIIIKLALAIVILGVLNILYSEDNDILSMLELIGYDTRGVKVKDHKFKLLK